ncbi:GNAT family N-acetyltransferase [Noviherbaspirillum galbum]|uniref:GNAT family N-acetyltransferase n=1 Tax=Noviherbaspirillum galbum TaxID=2709383 RepID=A0A6B3SGF9_9BURK|nr:GNAT family N-acetyltransferase [Noviherbaspirillum galbum]NEX59710.1 GNAT family N-acetyltransferase [Noviherbaspirillum galbum]
MRRETAARLVTGDWESIKEGAQAVRYDVFVVEQHVPLEMEWDEMDALSLHVVAYDDAGKAIGTGRLLPDGHIGRMAVRPEARNSGLGGRMLQALMDKARERGDQTVVLHAQTQAERFYQRHGFAREGEEFMEAGIAHVTMRRELC